MTNTPEPEEKHSWKLTEEQWIEACRLYEVEDSNLVDVADKFGVSRQALSKRFKTAGVVRGSKIPKPESEEIAPDRFSNKREEWIEETRMDGYNALRQSAMLVRKVIVDQLKAKKPVDEIEDQVRTVHRYNRILIENTEARLRLLNADDHIDNDDLPMLRVDDLTDEEILQHHKDAGVFDESTTVEEMLQEEIELGNLDS